MEIRNVVKTAIGAAAIVAAVGVTHHWVSLLSSRQHILENAVRDLRSHKNSTEDAPDEVPRIVPASASATTVDSTTWVDVQKAVKDTVIQVYCSTFEFNWIEPYRAPEQNESVGSGFFINEEGDFLTNFHVVNQAVSVQVQIPSLGQERLDAEIIGVTPERDIALARLTPMAMERVCSVLGKVPYLKLGDSDKIRRGQDILALGYPLGQDHLKSTQGIVSGNERVKILANQLCLQITAPLNPGSSGGPSLNAAGEVIGVNFAGIVAAQNVGYIIPINDLKNAIKDLYQQRLLRKPTLGCVFEPTTLDMSRFLKNPEGEGFYIVRVAKNSLAEKAGIQDGDTLYEINGYRLDAYGDTIVPWSEDKVSIIDLLNRCEVGDDIRLVLYRKGKRLEVSFKLEPRAVWPIRFMYPQYENVDYEVIGGIVIMELALNHLPYLVEGASTLLKYFSPENQYEQELIITHVIPTSPAYRMPRVNSMRTLTPGLLIDEVNGVKVRSLKEFRDAVRNNKDKQYLTVLVQDKRLFVLSVDAILREEDRLASTFFYRKSTLLAALRGAEKSN